MVAKGSLVFSIFLFLLCAHHVEAHQIKTDGNMSVLLHTDPNDDPYAGTTTILHFVFTDSSKQFQMEACDCQVFIAPYAEREGIEQNGFKLDLNSSTVSLVLGSHAFTHVFPKRDVYTILVRGEPKEEGEFEPFSVSYDLRIAKGENLTTPIPQSYLSERFFSIAELVTLVLIFVVVVAILVQRRFFKK